jgi:hypothetical protein
MSTPGDLSTLSDRFMAHVALAVLERRTTTALRMRLEEKMRTHGDTVSEAKAADMRAVIEWLKLNEGKP